MLQHLFSLFGNRTSIPGSVNGARVGSPFRVTCSVRLFTGILVASYRNKTRETDHVLHARSKVNILYYLLCWCTHIPVSHNVNRVVLAGIVGAFVGHVQRITYTPKLTQTCYSVLRLCE